MRHTNNDRHVDVEMGMSVSKLDILRWYKLDQTYVLYSYTYAT